LMGKSQMPGARPVEAGQAVEHRGLAGAVGADDGGDVAPIGGEGHVVHRLDAAEMHRQALHVEQRRFGSVGRFAHDAPLGLSRIEGARLARMPRGRQIMMPTIAAPNSSMRNWSNSRPNSGSVTST